MNKKIIEEDVEDIIEETEELWGKFAGKNILITGACGMLASYLVDTFRQINKSVNKNNPSNLYLLIRNRKKPFGMDKNIFYVGCDIAKDSSLEKIPYHFIIHAASKAAPKNYMKNMIDTVNTNVLGIYNLLKVVSRETESFLFFSSSEIYGQSNLPADGGEPIKEIDLNEIDHLSERASYSMSKKFGETILMTYFREKKLPIKIARIFHTFGPRLSLNDGRIFSDFIKNGIKGNNIEILGDKDIVRSFNYIKDATVMFLKILTSDRNGEIYNVAGKNLASVEEFAKIVKKWADKLNNEKKIKVVIKNKDVKYYKGAVKKISADISKFKNDFGWEPKTNLDEAVERTMKYYLE